YTFSWHGFRRASEADRVYGVLIPPFHEIFFEAEIAGRGINPGFNPHVAHRENAWSNTVLMRNIAGGLRKGLAFRHQLGAQEMGRQIAVANAEPCRLTEFPHRLKAMKGISTNSPSTLAAQNVREHIGDGVDVGGDVQSPPLVVVAGIHDDREFFRRKHAAKAVDKFCSPSAAGKHRNHAALRA